MHAFLPVPECAPFLEDELLRAGFRVSGTETPGILLTEGLPSLAAFACQCLPNVQKMEAASINAWAEAVLGTIAGVLPDSQPWRLHIWPAYGEGRAGQHRCGLIRESFVTRLKKIRRSLLRGLEDHVQPFTASTSLVQVMLTSPTHGLVSASVAPQPHELRAIISSYVAGVVPVAEDKSAPSRAFAKVIEAELRLGQRIERGQTCVDLGAAPGSWTYVALHRGAHVTAVDRSPLRADLMHNPRLHFHRGDAFKFRPEQPVDWLVCDIIAAPQRSIDLLLLWLRERLMRRFVVTVKFKGSDEYPLLDQMKDQAAPLCSDFRLTRLCANKNEVSAFGVV